MSTTNDSPLVRVENLHKQYRLGDEIIHALRGVSLSAARGEFVAIMGASGSGKTTLLHLVGGLDVPDEGEVHIEENAINRMPDEERTLFRRRRLGIVFQVFNLMPTLSAVENVMLPLLVDGRPANEAQRLAEELLARVHLAHRHKHRPALMSGGEQQRVAIARALMNKPSLLLADEPTGNLDPTSSQQIWTLLRELSSQTATTILMVTHEPQAAAWADTVHFIREGRLAGSAQPEGSGDAALVADRYAQLAS